MKMQINVLLWSIQYIVDNFKESSSSRTNQISYTAKEKIPKVSINKTQLDLCVCAFQESLSAIVHAIRSGGNLPAAGEDHDFYYSFSDFREFRTAQGARLLSK